MNSDTDGKKPSSADSNEEVEDTSATPHTHTHTITQSERRERKQTVLAQGYLLPSPAKMHPSGLRSVQASKHQQTHMKPDPLFARAPAKGPNMKDSPNTMFTERICSKNTTGNPWYDPYYPIPAPPHSQHTNACIHAKWTVGTQPLTSGLIPLSCTQTHHSLTQNSNVIK